MTSRNKIFDQVAGEERESVAKDFFYKNTHNRITCFERRQKKLYQDEGKPKKS